MSHAVRPRRSVLYVPGANERALAKARTLAADAFIFDLEDAVAPDAKAAARASVCEALRANDDGARERIVRVNASTTPWGRDDLAAVATSNADAVLLPKVESGDAVREAVAILEASGASSTLAVHCMIETPLGVLHAEDIARSSPRLACLVMGTSDLAKDLHAAAPRSRLPLLASLGICLLAARAYGLAILDGVHLHLADDAGFDDECRQGRELGFDGKTLIHPKTIAAANRIFSPSGEELEWSRRVIAAHEEATRMGKGVVVVDGKLVERLHADVARRTIKIAEAIAALDARG